MIVQFAADVPPPSRRLIRQTANRLSRKWGFTDYELHVDLKTDDKTMAEIERHVSSRILNLHLSANRLDPEMLRRDLFHEFWHVATWRLADWLETVLALLSKRRRRQIESDIRREFEAAHEDAVQLWLKELT